jgi:hypothetical protein
MRLFRRFLYVLHGGNIEGTGRNQQMLSRFRGRFGVSGILAVIALVFAMLGGAYAASGFTKAQEKFIVKTAKKYAGKPGKAGPVGPAGSTGSKGATGSEGPMGPEGPEGEPWTAGGTLPPGATEVGTWQLQENTFESGNAMLSFPIPLSEADAEHISTTASAHIMNTEAASPPNGCTGGSPAEPKADPGNICLYVSHAFSFSGTLQNELFLCKLDGESCGQMTNPISQPQVDPAGAELEAGSFHNKIVFGSFAVTAQE